MFSITSPGPALLEARLVPSGDDSLDVDNSAWLSLPQARDLKVRVSNDLYSWRHAVQVLERMELDDAEESTSLNYDLVVSAVGRNLNWRLR